MSQALSRKDLEKVLAIESILIELQMRDGWSSRVQAERIYEAMHSKKARKKVKKPWEHFSIKST